MINCWTTIVEHANFSCFYKDLIVSVKYCIQKNVAKFYLTIFQRHP